MRLLRAAPEVWELVGGLEATASPHGATAPARPGALAVLEAVPQHFCTPDGLWDPQVVAGPRCSLRQDLSRGCTRAFVHLLRARGLACQVRQQNATECCAIPSGNGDVGALAGNWRNQHLAEGLGLGPSFGAGVDTGGGGTEAPVGDTEAAAAAAATTTAVAAVPLLRLFRALVPSHALHRAAHTRVADCTHLGFAQQLLSVRTILVYLSSLQP
jgi:hypothetical protein